VKEGRQGSEIVSKPGRDQKNVQDLGEESSSRKTKGGKNGEKKKMREAGEIKGFYREGGKEVILSPEGKRGQKGF